MMAKTQEPRPFYFSPGGAAEAVQVSEKTVRRWIKSGLLPVVRVGRIVRVRRMDLDRLMENHLCRAHPEEE